MNFIEGNTVASVVAIAFSESYFATRKNLGDNARDHLTYLIILCI